MNPQYIIAVGDEQQGPYSYDDLVMYEKTGDVNAQTPVRLEGREVWKKWYELKAERLAMLARKKEFEAARGQLGPALASASFIPTTSHPEGPQLSRAIYIVLALLLGGLGIHDFYAGHLGRGAVILIATLLSVLVIVSGFMLGAAIAAVLGIFVLGEIIMETEDGTGRPMR